MFILRNTKAPNQGSEVKYDGGFDVIDSMLHSSEYLDQISYNIIVTCSICISGEQTYDFYWRSNIIRILRNQLIQIIFILLNMLDIKSVWLNFLINTIHFASSIKAPLQV